MGYWYVYGFRNIRFYFFSWNFFYNVYLYYIRDVFLEKKDYMYVDILILFGLEVVFKSNSFIILKLFYR